MKHQEFLEIEKNDETDEEEGKLDSQTIKELTDWLREKLKFSELS